jgi:hypothetical protein
MFEFQPWECCNEYYPVLNTKNNDNEVENSCSLDEIISEKIGISVEQYRSILIGFGGKPTNFWKDSNDIIFDNVEQMTEAIQYLNELFQVVFKFMEV